jgi:excisionase family DNA binding protein
MKTQQQVYAERALEMKRARALRDGKREIAGAALDTSRPGVFPGQSDQDVLLTREETAAYLRCSLPTLEVWARNGEGPRVVRVGRSVRYRLSDLRAFVERDALQSA